MTRWSSPAVRSIRTCGASSLRRSPIKEVFDQKKVVAAVCHLLIEAGIAKGRRMTSYKSIKTDVINAGAKWEFQGGSR